jgi:Uma2 family endonuclease
MSVADAKTLEGTRAPTDPRASEEGLEVDVSHLVTEDDAPVDNIFSQIQMRLLTEPLLSSWVPGRDFVALSNVGLFSAVHRPPVVPDVLLSLDVRLPENLSEKKNRSYFVWQFGKAPDVVVEIVSNREGGETDRKMEEYARIGVPYYAIFDPARHLMPRDLTFLELRGRHYAPLSPPSVPECGLSLVVWEGAYEGETTRWLRWADDQGNLIPTGAERAEAERQRTEAERQRAEAERQRAEAERQRAEAERQRAYAERQRADALAAKLREAGIDPDAL